MTCIVAILKTIKPMLFKKLLLLIIVFSSLSGYAQKKQIEFESNGRSQAETQQNPFKKFIGEWTLKNDDWTHNWGGDTETIKIPNHHTVNQEINTNHSLLSIIDGPEPNGHIFWTYNSNTKEVHHLSSFGSIRIGNGSGTINDKGDVTLKLQFEGEQEGTYRIYNYKWINNDEYHMKSVQYNENDELTGLFYEGVFIRIKTDKEIEVREEIEEILGVLDNNEISIEEQLKVYSENVVHMAPDTAIINGKQQLKTYLEKQRDIGIPEMFHKIIDLEILGDTIVMQGEVSGDFYINNQKEPISFKTKNLFIFGREIGELKIKKIIYNFSPVE
jgi:ketosteroid isomerase-like protein